MEKKQKEKTEYDFSWKVAILALIGIFIDSFGIILTKKAHD